MADKLATLGDITIDPETLTLGFDRRRFTSMFQQARRIKEIEKRYQETAQAWACRKRDYDLEDVIRKAILASLEPEHCERNWHQRLAHGAKRFLRLFGLDTLIGSH